MLRKNDVNWVKEYRASFGFKQGSPMTGKERAQFARIRKRIEETLSGLSELLENLPEDQIRQTFTKNNLEPFLEELFTMDKTDLDEKKEEERRKRILDIWSVLFSSFLAREIYGFKILGSDIMPILMTRLPPTAQGILYETRREKK